MMQLRVVSVDLFERHVTLRLPFRFGVATVTQCPQAFVQVQIEAGSKRFKGATAELMVPKWFDKSPGLTHEQNFEQLRQALRNAAQSYTSSPDDLSPYAFSQSAGEAAIQTGVAQGLPRLAAQFGPALIDKSIADAALRAASLGWVDGLRANLLGDPFSSTLNIVKPMTVALRHTVGLADRLTASEAGPDPADGLPATLEAAIQFYGLQHFKLKLSGQLDADIERLSRISAVLGAHGSDYRVTLDGNESFADVQALGEFWQALVQAPQTASLLKRTLLLEQPLPRRMALDASIASLGINVPVILDESDDRDDVLERGLALGYRGISSKACKGIYRALHSAARIAQDPLHLLLSGEDLTCQAGLAVQQDTLLAASLGITHIERNGHHYVDGFGIAPELEAQGFAKDHPGFYTTEQGRARLAVRAGQLDLTSLHTPGFASAAQPQWDSMKPIV